MTSRLPREHDSKPRAKPQAADAPVRVRPEGEGPGRERRSKHRVRDDQQTGQGSMSALSKLRMIERRRAALTPGRDDSKD